MAADNVVTITSTGDAITGSTRKPVSDVSGSGTKATHFATQRPAFADSDLEPLLEQHNVQINAQPENQPTPLWQTLLWGFGPTLLLVLGFFWLSRRAAGAMGGGVMGMGQSRARVYDAERPATSFADVAGIDEAEDELQEVVDFLREPQKYQRLGGSMPKGVLLVGSPGTGKTLRARAVAGEARVPFFDAVGRNRTSGVRLGGHDEQEQTLNQILTEMDGFDAREGVVVLAATNRADVLDPALLRAGRFDRRVIVQPPDRAGRLAILRIHTRQVVLDRDVSLEGLAAQTVGLVGADLRNLANEAALLAARRGRPAVATADFEDALEKIALGAARHVALSAADRERVAYHESGHALLGLLLPGADPVRKVSIVPRGSALGVTMQSPDDDHVNYTEEYLRGRIVGALGGRAAEQLVYGTITTGAESDLQQVTRIAREMVVRWGMSPRVGALSFPEEAAAGGIGFQKPFSDATGRLIDEEIKRIVDECLAVAQDMLAANRERLDRLAAALLREESLDEAAVRAAVGPVPADPQVRRAAAMTAASGA